MAQQSPRNSINPQNGLPSYLTSDRLSMADPFGFRFDQLKSKRDSDMTSLASDNSLFSVKEKAQSASPRRSFFGRRSNRSKKLPTESRKGPQDPLDLIYSKYPAAAFSVSH